MLERNRDFAEVYAHLGRAYEQKRMFREAMDAYEKRSAMIGDNTPTASALHTAPVRDAVDFWQKRLKLEEVKLDGSPSDDAETLAQLGETDQAIARLEQSCDKRFSRVAYLNVDPNFDSLRDHPRFNELLRRVRLGK